MGNLYIVSGDIIKNAEKAEAIVNSTNKYMDFGSGVCGAIYKAAGVELLETYCHSKWQKEMQVNEIRITTGFRLLKEIIHIYCPRYYEEKEPLEKLKESYIKLLKTIQEEQYKSVIIPSLGTGVHGYQHEDVAEMVINLLKDFTNNNDIDIIFDLMDDKTKETYLKYLPKD